MPRLLLLLVCSCSLAARPAFAEPSLGIQVPEGFEVSLYADDNLAHDIFSMTLDAQGRVVVAGSGYVKTLHDDDGDGRADRATLFSKVPASGAHGLLFDGHDLICTGDNAVMRLRDADGDGQADGPGEVWTALRHPEHGANGLVRGPDGCYYLICGNDAGVSEKQITTAHSPVAKPRSGAVVRFSAEGKPLEVVAHGFRNPYDLDFNTQGQLFTVDADGERDHHLPWYAPTRLFDIGQGMEHGWLLMGWARGWNRPASFFDSGPRLVTIGRGSPTGVVAYRHRAFPEHYRGGILAACWTLGRVYYFPLASAGASYRSSLEVFMQTTGDVGFAPCDLAVGRQGELFVAIGGRRTRGSVFRVTYRGVAAKGDTASAGDRRGVDDVLSADQPLASWSRAAWVPLARSLGADAFAKAASDPSRSAAARVRAIEVLVELCGGVDPETARKCAQAQLPPVRSRVAWALSRAPLGDEQVRILAQLTGDDDASVQRSAWEALNYADRIDAEPSPQPDWSRGLSSTERRVRSAAIAVAARTGASSYQSFLSRVRLRQDAWRFRLAQVRVRREGLSDPESYRLTADDANLCLQAFAAASDDADLRLEALRLLQLGLGDVRTAEGQAEVYCGYVANGAAQVDVSVRQQLASALAPAFPSADAEVNRELVRTLGMLSADSTPLLSAISMGWTDNSTVEEDLHYLIVASLLSAPRSGEVRQAIVRGLLSLHGKLDAQEQFISRNWPLRVGEMFDALCERDAELATALIESDRFGHREHALFIEHLPKAMRPEAIEKLWNATVQRGDTPTPEMVQLIGALPQATRLPLVRAQWEESALRDAILIVLARTPQSEDRERLISGLSSPQSGVVERCAKALVHLGIQCTSAELAAALRALKLSCATPKQEEPRGALLKLVNFWTEENSDVDLDPDPTKVYIGWYEMFDNYYPAEAARLRSSSGADAAGWKKRLAVIDWNQGDAARGKAVFEVRACHRCHQANGHLGPELKGAVSRMSRDDLFTAIIDPNLEVSPAYQTTALATRSGQVYHGLVVYESPETTLLQTGPDTTVRVLNGETSSMRKSGQSLMPTGLLDPLSDQELGDLYAYLRTLAK